MPMLDSRVAIDLQPIDRDLNHLELDEWRRGYQDCMDGKELIAHIRDTMPYLRGYQDCHNGVQILAKIKLDGKVVDQIQGCFTKKAVREVTLADEYKG